MIVSASMILPVREIIVKGWNVDRFGQGRSADKNPPGSACCSRGRRPGPHQRLGGESGQAEASSVLLEPVPGMTFTARQPPGSLRR